MWRLCLPTLQKVHLRLLMAIIYLIIFLSSICKIKLTPFVAKFEKNNNLEFCLYRRTFLQTFKTL